MPLAVRSKRWVCCRSLARTAGFESTRGSDNCLYEFVGCQTDVCATGLSRGFPPNVKCLGVTSKHRRYGGLGLLALPSHKKENEDDVRRSFQVLKW